MRAKTEKPENLSFDPKGCSFYLVSICSGNFTGVGFYLNKGVVHTDIRDKLKGEGSFDLWGYLEDGTYASDEDEQTLFGDLDCNEDPPEYYELGE